MVTKPVEIPCMSSAEATFAATITHATAVMEMAILIITHFKPTFSAIAFPMAFVRVLSPLLRELLLLYLKCLECQAKNPQVSRARVACNASGEQDDLCCCKDRSECIRCPLSHPLR
jgi:hypothetical protein